MLQYNVSISASLYASYYFELRTLCEKKNATLNMKPLGADEAKSLEARTAAFETNAKQTRKWQSMSVAEGCARARPPAPAPKAFRSARPYPRPPQGVARREQHGGAELNEVSYCRTNVVNFHTLPLRGSGRWTAPPRWPRDALCGTQ